METQALVELLALRDVLVASGTAALVAVSEATWRAVVASADNALIFRDHSSNAALHAVRATSSHFRQPQKVSVE